MILGTDASAVFEEFVERLHQDSVRCFGLGDLWPDRATLGGRSSSGIHG